MVTTKEQARVHIRWMIRRDLEQVLRIDNEAFETPWDEEQFLTFQRKPHAIAAVAEVSEMVVGFMVYELEDRSLRLVKLAVEDRWRRLLVGRQLIAKLIRGLHNHHRTRIVTNVHDANIIAHLFFRSLRFRATRVLRSHYEDGGDAYVFVFELK